LEGNIKNVTGLEIILLVEPVYGVK